MKYLMIFLAFLLMGCSSSSLTTYDFSGSWIATAPFSTSMVVLREDGTCTFYMYVGSPYAHTWNGYWKGEHLQLIILNTAKKPVAMANLTGSAKFYIYMFNDTHRFHRYGSRGGLD